MAQNASAHARGATQWHGYSARVSGFRSTSTRAGAGRETSTRVQQRRSLLRKCVIGGMHAAFTAGRQSLHAATSRLTGEAGGDGYTAGPLRKFSATSSYVDPVHGYAKETLCRPGDTTTDIDARSRQRSDPHGAVKS
jgi:hypothetical protein